MNTTNRNAAARGFVLAGLLAAAAIAQAAPTNEPAAGADMLTIAQAVVIAESTQQGTAYSVRREGDRREVVYHVKVSTPERGVVDVHVAAFGGRVVARDRDER